MSRSARIRSGPPASGSTRRGVAATAALVALLSACNAGGPIVPPNDGFAIRIDLLCTTCDDFLRCRREPDDAVAPPGAREPLLVYRLEEQGFRAQVATIGDYLFQLFRQKTGHQRPLAIYRDDGRTRTVERLRAGARVDGLAGLITLPDSAIDMRSGDWLDLRGGRLGRCEALVRREGYALIREFLGQSPASRGVGAARAPVPAPAAAPAPGPAP